MMKRILAAALALLLIVPFASCAAQPGAAGAGVQSGKAYALQDFSGTSGQNNLAPAVDSKGRLVVASQADGAPVVLTTYDASGNKVSDVTTDITDTATNFTLDAKDTAYILAGSNVDILDASGKTTTQVPVGDIMSQQQAQMDAKSGSKGQASGGPQASAGPETPEKENTASEPEGIPALGLAASSDGSIFLSFDATGVVQVDKTGSQIRAFGTGSMNLICMNDKEQLVVYSIGKTRPMLTTYDTQSGSQAAQQNVAFNPDLIFYDKQGKRVLYMDREGIYPVNADGTSGDAIIMLSNFALSYASHGFMGFAMDGAQTIYIALSDFSPDPEGSKEGGKGLLDESYIDRLALVDASTIPQKKILTIAGLTVGGGVDAAIAAFQKTHPDYQINLKTYSNQVAGIKGSGQSPETLIQQFNTDVMASNSADIYILFNLPYDDYIRQGLLADLGPMMAADNMDMTKYYSNIFDACKVNGKLYTLPITFAYDAFIGNSAYMPASDTPSIDDFLNAAEALPAGVAALPKEDAMQALDNYMYYNITYFVDLDSKAAGFNSPEFIDILNRFKTLADTKMGATGPREQDPIEQIGDGRLAFTVQDIRGLTDIPSFIAFAGGNVRFENIPSMTPNTYSFEVRELYGINASSQNKDIAWEFLKTLLSPDIHSYMQKVDGFPVDRALMQYMIQEEVSSTGFTASNGEREVDVKPLTQEQCDAFTANFDKLNTALFAPGQKMDDIMGVLEEELPSFFSGQKSAEDVAVLIQNRVDIILNE